MSDNNFNAKRAMVAEFDKELVFHIRYGQDDRVKSMLNTDLVKDFDDMGTLLHYAALYGKESITRHLLELGIEIDSLGRDSKTALMLAVEHRRSATVEILLEAGANVDIADADGRTALQMVLDPNYRRSNIAEQFIRKLKTKIGTTQELAAKLIAAGGNIFHAALLGDIDLAECMLERGVDIDSRGFHGKTALHVAAEIMDILLAKRLINHGANVNAVDERGNCPLLVSAANSNYFMVEFLLEKGADPNCKGCVSKQTPLSAILKKPKADPPMLHEYAELLLQHGAIPRNASSKRTIFDYALYWSSHETIKMLISHLAILEMFGTSVTKSVMFCGDENNQSKVSEFQTFHEMCLQVLKIPVFEKMTLLDLLNTSEHKMRLLVRREAFASKIEGFCFEHKLSDLFSYYYKTVTKRIDEASRLMNLQDEAIPVICDIFNANYDLCYNFATKVVGYLNECDLQQLVRV